VDGVAKKFTGLTGFFRIYRINNFRDEKPSFK
jgi:hypothetical protein